MNTMEIAVCSKCEVNGTAYKSGDKVSIPDWLAVGFRRRQVLLGLEKVEVLPALVEAK